MMVTDRKVGVCCLFMARCIYSKSLFRYLIKIILYTEYEKALKNG